MESFLFPGWAQREPGAGAEPRLVKDSDARPQPGVWSRMEKWTTRVAQAQRLSSTLSWCITTHRTREDLCARRPEGQERPLLRNLAIRPPQSGSGSKPIARKEMADTSSTKLSRAFKGSKSRAKNRCSSLSGGASEMPRKKKACRGCRKCNAKHVL